MPQNYYQYSNTFIDGNVAQANEIKTEFEAVQTGLDQFYDSLQTQFTSQTDQFTTLTTTVNGDIEAFKTSVNADVASFTSSINADFSSFTSSINADFSSFTTSTDAAVENNKLSVTGHINDVELALKNQFAALSQSVSTSIENLHTAVEGLNNYKGVWSSLSGALAAPASVVHNGRVWRLTESVSPVQAHEPGVSSVWVATADVVGRDGVFINQSGNQTQIYLDEIYALNHHFLYG